MKTIIKSDKYDDFMNNIVYSAFFIHQLFFLLSVSAMARAIPDLRKIVNSIIMFSFAIMCFAIVYYFFRGKFSVKEIVIYIIIAIPLLISLYNYRVVMVISNLFYVAIFKNVDIKKSLRIVLYATITGFVINILLSIFTTYVGKAVQTNHDGTPRVRYGMGFYYAYITGYYYMTIVIMFVLAYDNFGYLLYAVLFALNFIIFKFTDTKAPFAYTTILLILHLIYVKLKFKIFVGMFKIVVVSSYIFSTLIAILLPVFYVQGNKIWDLLNLIVNGRLRLTQNSFIACGWTWFGQSASLWNEGVHWADSAIVLMFIQNGLIVLIMSVLFMTFFSYMAVKINHKPLMIVLLIIAVRSIFDLGFMTMQLGPVIIMFYDVYNKYRSGIVCDY